MVGHPRHDRDDGVVAELLGRPSRSQLSGYVPRGYQRGNLTKFNGLILRLGIPPILSVGMVVRFNDLLKETGGDGFIEDSFLLGSLTTVIMLVGVVVAFGLGPV